ncbi:MAG: sulfatase-like hydrolase/transferase [Candidatus Hydrogenedentes bacterium]|nr:sulfatase-like hydrolase/transferase [Candidatus Hydrogenedentota bacterium]
MKRRQFLQLAGTTAAAAVMSDAASAQNNNRPNILWLSCEDMSPHLGCYGHQQAATPNLDAFAEEGARYTHAFSIAGVCAPSRSCIITGMYPTTLGTLHMRCSNPPPDYVKCFPEYLRDAGYYCTNNSKTDYNFPPPASAWDESSKKAHWRNRKEPSQPFFSVFNFVGTNPRLELCRPIWTRVCVRCCLHRRTIPMKCRSPPTIPTHQSFASTGRTILI